MSEFSTGLKTNLLVNEIKRYNPIYWKQINRTLNEYPQLFYELAEPLVNYAESILGENWASELASGYIAFVNEVNRAQSIYEREGKYQHSSFDEVAKLTYLSKEFMRDYHWGVYVTTFAWKHHLLLNDFFNRMFLRNLECKKDGFLVDLGTGSGVWLSLSLRRLQGWKAAGVDISPTSVAWANALLKAADLSGNSRVTEEDALLFHPNTQADAVISCFLLEHLEVPGALLQNIYRVLKPGASAFVCGALTAAEIDHIYEFRRESELIRLAEENGFRVVASFSSSPQGISLERRYLPRSMAMVLEKRRGEWW
jgi:ubiquinone/menaquinone biosynthesis C-methylase UbiE